ncbi:MAG: tryptophan synthase subunit alpha [Planctomycetota bacterium]|jgi:tryptophan synthase alpha chain
MGRIGERFAQLKEEKKCALMPYFMAHYPDAETFGDILLSAQNSGADFIEIGLPFSDPIADGPAIQEVGQEALRSHANAENVFRFLTRLNGRLSIPLVIMSYVNIPLRYGVEAFFDDASCAGIKGAIIPDLSLEESALFMEVAGRYGIDLIQFVTPTTSGERVADIAAAAKGFIYIISVTGVTGERPEAVFDLEGSIAAIRARTDLPVCVGFGIASEEQAANISKFADGIIIGSALVKIIRESRGPTAGVAAFLSGIRKRIDSREE